MWMRVHIFKQISCKYVRSLQHAHNTTIKSVPEAVKLTSQFIEYFKTINDSESSNIKSSLPGNPIVTINNSKSIKSLIEFDRYMCDNAPKLSSTEILSYLCIYVERTPRNITEFTFYNTANSILAHRLEELSAQEIVQFMFMVALMKKCYESSKYMKKCLSHLNAYPEKIQHLSLTDLVILCNSTFKTSIRIYNKNLLECIQKSLMENLQLLEDPGILITLVKSLRHNQYQREELLATLSAAIFFNKTYKHYTFTAISHILPLYADYLYYDEELFKLFTAIAVDQLKSSKIQEKNVYFVDNIRGKDIRRFLWCCSYIAHPLSTEHLKLIEEQLYRRYVAGHFEAEIGALLDTVYYLWIIEYHSKKLLYACKNNVEAIRKQPKSNILLNMLLVCMQIENPYLYKQFGHKAQNFSQDVKKEMGMRPHLMRVHNMLKLFMSDLNINRLEVEYQIPHFNVAGITGYRKNVYKAFVVEVLDDTNSVKNADNKVNGRLQTKLRLMYKLDLQIVVLNSEDFEEMNENDFKSYIRREMSIVS